MNRMKMMCGLLLLLCMPVLLDAQNRLAKVKLFPANREERLEMIGFLQIDHFMPTADGAVMAEISLNDLARLKKSRYKHEVVIPDVSRWLDSANKVYFRSLKRGRSENERVAMERPGSVIDQIIARPAAFEVKETFAGYYRFSEMEAAMNTLVATYGSIASKQSIGKTGTATGAGNRDIWAIKISDNVSMDESEPEALFIGLQHPREAITGASMIFFMQYLCEQYMANNPQVKDLVNSREIYIIPCFNPDGYEENYTSTSGNGGGAWRKNHRFISGSDYGVDLNRNWGVDWGNCNTPIQGNALSCGSNDPGDDTYYGSNAFSEAETQALRAFTKTRHFTVAFDQHAYGPYYSIPVGRESLHNDANEVRMTKKDSNFYMTIPALMGKYNGMRTANSYDALGYEVAGGFKDWMLMGEIGVGTKDTVWGLTGEGAAGGGNQAFAADGVANFWAPADQIVTLCKGMCYQNIQLAYAAGSYARIEDASDFALTAKSGTLSYNLTRLGIGNTPVTVSIVPLENMGAVGSPVTVNSLTYFETATRSIAYTLPAALTNGQRVRFAWKVVSDGITFMDTVTKFYNPTLLFSDDMEGTIGTKWTQTTSDGGSSGFSYTYTDGSWVFTTAGGLGNSKALSESANGTRYTSSTRSVVQCSSTFNLSDATAAYLTFWTKHALENFRDKVQVQFSTDGTTWTPVEGISTVEEPGTKDGATLNGMPALTGINPTWTQERFNLTAFRGFSSVRFRFVFTSDNDPTTFFYERDEGIFIDEVKLFKSTSPLVSLPVRFLTFGAALQQDKTALLKWEAVADQQHSHYVVERSTDGVSFTALGRVNADAPNQYVDAQPVVGTNYYRLRQIDKNGLETLSKIVSVSLKPSFNLSAYPNPATEKVRLAISTDKLVNVSLTVTDVTGKNFYKTAARSVNGTVEIEINVNKWPSQVYIIKATDRNNKVLSIQRLLKQ